MRRYLAGIFFVLIGTVAADDPAFADVATASIAGTVTSAESGLPLVGVLVTVEQNLFLGGIHVVTTTTTDAAGKYLVEGLDPNPGWPYQVKADGGDFRVVQHWDGADCPPVPLYCSYANGIAVSAGQTTQGIDLALHSAGVLQGHVTRADTHAPVAGAGIAPFYYTSTDANGAYRLRSVPLGQYTIWADAVGLITTFNDGQQCDDFLDCSDIVAQPFDITANATTTVDIALAPGVTVSGLVYVEGVPDAPRPEVRLYNESDPQRPYVTGLSAEIPPSLNDYVFRGLIARTYSVRFGDPADSRYVSEYYDNVACDQDVCAGVAQFVTVPGQQIADMDATVAPRQKVVGRVIDAVSQAPLASADVQALTVQGTIWGSYWNTIVETHSDAAGNFTLAGIPADTAIALRVNAANHLGVQTPDVICDAINGFCQSSNTYIPPNSVVADTTLDVGDLPLSQGATISGRVTNLRDGQGLPSSQIALYMADQYGAFYSTDSDGNYSTGMVRTGTFKVIASSLYESQMYDHVNCADLGMCDLGLATPIAVSGTGTFFGVDFSLHDPEIIFSSGFDN